MKPRHAFVVLLHYPMVDRTGKEVATAVTNLDIHDIARSSKTFGVDRYFVVHPEPEQEKVVMGILGHWKSEVSKVYHPARAQALDQVEFLRSFEEAINEATRISGGHKPLIVMPDARDIPDAVPYSEIRRQWQGGEIPCLMIVFGTGWGISPRYFNRMDVVAKPIKGPGKYNHLSVRAAAAIVMDRIFGDY